MFCPQANLMKNETAFPYLECKRERERKIKSPGF